MVKKLLLCVVLACLFTSIIFGQQNLSVPLGDPVYSIIEHIEIRDYVSNLRTAKPYSLNMVLDTLNKALDHKDISIQEKEIINDTLERLQPQPKTIVEAGASAWNVIADYSKTGAYRYENEYFENSTDLPNEITIDDHVYTIKDNSFPVTLDIGTSISTLLSANLNEPSVSFNSEFDFFIKGDISEYFSYNFNVGARLLKLDLSSHSPFSFSPNWDGYLFSLSDPGSFIGISEDFVAGVQMLPEMGFSFWDEKVNINFSRIRRDWGTGNGNLVLSQNAQPFVGFEVNMRPVDFINLSTVTGILEYYRENDIKVDAAKFQNGYSAFVGEIFFGDYGYLGITSAAVWPKRFELGYLLPVMLPFLYQSNIGDFDNVLLGASFGVSVPKYADFYFNLFLDEINPSSSDFFHKDRNMYSFQAGMKVALPNTPFVTMNFQYTKLEPYMYTHPGTETPWHQNEINTSYVNHGENLGYYLPPNSDELKITATSIPFWYLKTNLSYSLVRHGADYGDHKVDGSHPDDKNYYYDKNNPLAQPYHFTKYFLKDGVYEWIHSLGMSAQLDLRFVNDIPLTLNMGYTLSYKHHTLYDTVNVSFKPYSDDEYKNTWANYFTLSVKVW